MTTAPIVIFGYKRPEALKRLMKSLQASPLFASSTKIVFVDGPRNDQEAPLTQQTAEYAATFADEVHASKTNKGLGPSIIAGVSDVVNRCGKAIVLEDDLWCAPGFLDFMNQALNKYETDKRICSICGYSLKIKVPEGTDVYLSDRSSSWGWATWCDRWETVDWDVKDYPEFIADKTRKRSFNKAGSDMTGMLKGYMEGHNKSWAIRFCYWQWRNGLWSLHPAKSLVDNFGFGEDASNCQQKYSRFKIEMDNRKNPEWDFPNDIKPDPKILKQLHRYHSIPIRIYSRIRKMLNI